MSKKKWVSGKSLGLYDPDAAKKKPIIVKYRHIFEGRVWKSKFTFETTSKWNKFFNDVLFKSKKVRITVEELK